MTKLTKIYQFTLFMFVFSFPHLLPIYAASLYSSFSKLTGIEISETMTEISKKLGVPGEIITSDIRNVADKVVPESDVVIMNNVFEFFMEPEEELECWSRIFEFAKKGQIFVMVPALEQVFDRLEGDILDENKSVIHGISERLTVVDVSHDFDIHVYRVES